MPKIPPNSMRRLTRKQSVVAKMPASIQGKTSKRDADEEPCWKTVQLPPVVVLNLTRRPDRWAAVSKRLVEQGVLFERAAAVDGVKLSKNDLPATDVACEWSTASNARFVRQSFEDGDSYQHCKLMLSSGERACALSHVRLWRRCVSDPLRRPLVILEDDAEPRKKFSDRVRQAIYEVRGEAPDLLYLGYTQAAPWLRRISARVSEAEYLWTTVGYVVWPGGARKLLEHLPIDQPVDNFMAGLISARTVHGFAVTPAAVIQAAEWNVDSDIAHSDEKAWT